MGAAEEVSEAFGEAGEAADEEAVDDEFIKEVDDGGEGVLEVFDDAFFVDGVEVEAVFEEGDGDGVFFSAGVEDEACGEAEDEGGDGGDENEGVAFCMAAAVIGAVGVEGG